MMQHKQAIEVSNSGQHAVKLTCRFTINLSRNNHEWVLDILEFGAKLNNVTELYRHGNHALVLSEYHEVVRRIINSTDWYMARSSKSPDGKTLSVVFEYQGNDLLRDIGDK